MPEYKIERYSTCGDNRYEYGYLVEMLNKQGKEGWRYIDVFPPDNLWGYALLERDLKD